LDDRESLITFAHYIRSMLITFFDSKGIIHKDSLHLVKQLRIWQLLSRSFEAFDIRLKYRDLESGRCCTITRYLTIHLLSIFSLKSNLCTQSSYIHLIWLRATSLYSQKIEIKVERMLFRRHFSKTSKQLHHGH